MNDLSDEELVRLVQEGYISRYAELIRRYETKLVRFVKQKIRHIADVDDIVQETFINLYKGIDRVDVGRKFSSYLFTIARNNIIDFFRKRRATVSLEGLAEEPEADCDILEQVTRKEIGEQVRHVLSRIDVRYQKVLSLYYFDDLSYQMIARRLRLPIGTVRTHITRGKIALRALLKPV